jgi:hypothetical protein
VLTTILMLLALLETPPSRELDDSTKKAILSVMILIEICITLALEVCII